MITGFHIDMNIARFRCEYLKQWLQRLSNLGYDTILWEVENNIRWDTCPECVAADAFDKKEFKALLDYCDNLGLESIPVLQTLGHCEYVLKHNKYKHLAELPERIDQYCPLHPDLPDFLYKWMDEYLELFTHTKRFHIGADEAWSLGKCPKCKHYIENNSLSELYINHVNSISKYLLDKNIQPIIWADMVLHYPEALEMLSRDIMLCDFMYDTYRNSGQIWVWDRICDDGSSDLKTKDQLDDWTIKQFGKYIFPNNPNELETFYTADYLSDKGFKVVTCPASCSYPDNIFASRTMLHIKNTFDSFKKGRKQHLQGSILTSWTMHLLPWELQSPSLEIPNFILNNPRLSLEDYLKFYSENHFGINDNRFFEACELLSRGCLFTHHPTLGFNKSAFATADGHVGKTICEIRNNGKLETEIGNCLICIDEYTKGIEIFNQLLLGATKGQEEIKYWHLAGENLLNRAKTSTYFLTFNWGSEIKGNLKSKLEPHVLLAEMQTLKRRIKSFYLDQLKPDCVNNYMHWIYYPIENYFTKIGNLELNK
ncbi:MAG: hypothetical protein A2Y10_02435 [Planctomycetes bacterium GWF2_41_51]|nr:MAG: hypothetical protein A2Y10_02435 [Planctomycetes bacterium GWF2_41_51]HBG27273.1 hypothetical protein [Phycisphaerales bacterium]